MRVFGHQGPQEDRKSTEETETKQTNLRWEFFDTKAHKKTERAQKRQKQSKETETQQINLRWEFFVTKAHKKTEKTQKRQTPKRW